MLSGGGRPAREVYPDVVDQILAPRSNLTVMVFERLEESLVMFGEEHGWALRDLAHLRLKDGAGGRRRRAAAGTGDDRAGGGSGGQWVSSDARKAAAALHKPDMVVYSAAVQAGPWPWPPMHSTNQPCLHL